MKYRSFFFFTQVTLFSHLFTDTFLVPVLREIGSQTEAYSIHFRCETAFIDVKQK